MQKQTKTCPGQSKFESSFSEGSTESQAEIQVFSQALTHV